MQRGINGAFRQIECATAAVANFLNNGVAVGRPVRQRGEHDHVKMTFEHFAFHELELILVKLGVNAEPVVRYGAGLPLDAAENRCATFPERALRFLEILGLLQANESRLYCCEGGSFLSGERLAG